jgi:outer membrane biosynthesis protein TonB
MDKIKKTEQENNQKGTLVSLTVHSLLIFGILFMPVSKPKLNEKTQIQVELPKDMLGGGAALGLPDQGQGDTPSPGKPNPNAGGAPKPEPEPDPTPITPIKPAPAPKPVISKPAPAPPTKRIETTEDPNAVAIRRQQEAIKQKAEEEKYRQSQAEKARRKAEEDARTAEANQRAEEAAKRAAAESKFKNRKFGDGTGTGSGTSGGGGTGGGFGNSGKPGSGGRPDGDPDNRNLEGVGRGPGNISGFGNRKAANVPKCTNNSNEVGKASTCVRQYRFEPGSSNATGRIIINLIDR